MANMSKQSPRWFPQGFSFWVCRHFCKRQSAGGSRGFLEPSPAIIEQGGSCVHGGALLRCYRLHTARCSIALPRVPGCSGCKRVG